MLPLFLVFRCSWRGQSRCAAVLDDYQPGLAAKVLPGAQDPLDPQAQEIYEWADTCDVVTDMCAWGTPWRKRTRFRTWMLPQAVDWHILCRPQGPSKSCLFRGVPHVILRGKDAHGRSLTKRAAEYPPSLCRAIAAAMIDQGFQLSFGLVVKTSHLRVRK